MAELGKIPGDKTLYKTDAIGGDGQVIHPLLANTKEDGTGTWYAVVVDEKGALVAKSGVEAAMLSTLQEILIYQKATVLGLEILTREKLV